MLTASEGEFKLTPAGSHLAICTGVVDLGTQKSTYEGKEKHARKVRLIWELCEEKKDDGTPMTTGKSYTLSLADRSTLRAHLQSWRGLAFSPDELKKFDLVNILGKPCVLTIIHEPKAGGGGMRDSLSTITGLVKGMPIPKQVTPSMIFDIDEYSDESFDKLPAFLQKWILESPEGALARMKSAKHAPSGTQSDAMGDGGIPF